MAKIQPNWDLILPHPLAGRLYLRKGKPTSAVLCQVDDSITAVYDLQWRDVLNMIAYYKVRYFLKTTSKN